MVRKFAVGLCFLSLVLVFGLAGVLQADDAQGKVQAVKAEMNQLVVLDSTGKALTFQVEASCKVVLNNKEVQLSELRTGDQAAIRFEPQEEKLVALEVRCTR